MSKTGRPSANAKQFFCTECKTGYAWKQGLDTHNRKKHPKLTIVSNDNEQVLLKLFKDGLLTPDALTQALTKTQKPAYVVPTLDIGVIIENYESGKVDVNQLLPLVEPCINKLPGNIKEKKIKEAMEMIYKDQIYISGKYVKYLDHGKITTNEFTDKFCNILYDIIGNTVAKFLLLSLEQQDIDTLDEQQMNDRTDRTIAIGEIMTNTRQTNGTIILNIIKDGYKTDLIPPPVPVPIQIPIPIPDLVHVAA